ncbi:MAG: thiamine pyrophosphate-dependent enzyme [Candidatus Pacearchaeota archaeon]
MKKSKKITKKEIKKAERVCEISKSLFDTKVKNTWCPGCPNFLILDAFKRVICELVTSGQKKKEELVLVSDIGCNAKIYDYVNLSGFNALHGRILPVALGIKIANPNLKPICFGGDGGTYNEGLNHFISACRYNSDMVLIVHNNQVFSLTAGQASAVTEQGFVEKTHPFGVKEKPLNPIVLALEAGASFVARVSALDINEMKRVVEQATLHNGFAFVEILQPCLVFHNNSEFLKTSTYKINEMDFENALREARKWNYSQEGRVGVGIFFRKQERTFEQRNLEWKLKRKL